METNVVLVVIIIAALNAIRWYFHRRYQISHRSVLTRTNPIREWSLVLASMGSYSLPCLLWLFTDWIDFANYYSNSVLMWTGFALSLLSTMGYAWVHRTLGDNWSPVLEIREGHQLIVFGPYRWVRHPMYMFVWLGIMGMNFMIMNYVLLIASVSTTALLCMMRLPDEEKLMLGQFGERYRQYGNATKRLIPFVY